MQKLLGMGGVIALLGCMKGLFSDVMGGSAE